MRIRPSTHHVDGVTASISPIVLITDDIDTAVAIVVKQSAQSKPNLALLRGADQTSGVRRVAVLRLILYGDLDCMHTCSDRDHRPGHRRPILEYFGPQSPGRT